MPCQRNICCNTCIYIIHSIYNENGELVHEIFCPDRCNSLIDHMTCKFKDMPFPSYPHARTVLRCGNNFDINKYDEYEKLYTNY